jgi:hypothetical protein
MPVASGSSDRAIRIWQLSITTPALLFNTDTKLVLTRLAITAGAKTPFKTLLVRDAHATVYTLMEDVVAVNGRGDVRLVRSLRS